MKFSRVYSMFAAIAVIAIWSTSFSFSKVAIEHMGVWSFRLYSSIAGFMLIIPYLRRCFLDLMRLSVNAKFCVLLSALLSGSVVPAINNFALANSPASSVIVLINTMPAFVTLFEFMNRSPKSILGLLPAFLTVAGVVFFSGERGLTSSQVMILGNAFLWAVATWLAGSKYGNVDRFTKTACQTTFSLVTSVMVNMVIVFLFNGWIGVPDSFDIFSVLYSGVLNGSVVFFLWYLVIESYGAERSAYLTLITPLLGAAFAVLYLHERINLMQIWGALTIVFALFTKVILENTSITHRKRLV